jgi:TonB family protein
MLQEKKSKAVWQLKYVLLFPLVLGMLVYTSCESEKPTDAESTAEEPIEEMTIVGYGAGKTQEGGIPFTVVDEVPIFPGCEDAADKKACFHEKIQAHIRKNFRYPEAAQEQGIQGRVSSIFTIDKEGNVVDIKMRGPDELLENETGRILAKLPQMQPGKHEGKAVKVPFSIPITFRLEGNDEEELNKEIQKFGERGKDWVPFTKIDEAPVFPGCENAADKRACFLENIQKHIRKHFRYPQEAQELGIQGRVAIVFGVNANGEVVDIKTKGPSPILEAEAQRIVTRLPKMEPAKQDGKPADVIFSIPITFKLK